MPQEGWSTQRILAVSCAVGAAGAAGFWYWWALSRRRLARHCTDREVISSVAAVRATYDLSSKGFLPESCLLRLPPAFDAWEDIMDELPRLNRMRLLRGRVDSMTEVDLPAVAAAKPEELRRAFLVLSMLAHSYVHGDDVPWELLDGKALDGATSGSRPVPPQLSRPWLAVCRRLQMPPVLTAGATDLWNWRLSTDGKGAVPGNLELTSSLTGTATESNFHLTPCAMQAAAAEVVPKIFLADHLVRGGRDVQLAALLRELTDVLSEFKNIFSNGIGGVDPDVFYDVYRPLLNGFYPDGVVLDGIRPETFEPADFLVAEAAGSDAVRVRSKGPSAGQSTMILLFDLFLGVAHSGGTKEFQQEMLGYMPALHRQMVLDYRQKWSTAGPAGTALTVRDYVYSPGRSVELVTAYEDAARALRNVRRFHLATVTRFLTRTSTGTGASAWQILLQEALDSTHACISGKCPIKDASS